jgi:hypothetical protein
VRTTLDIDEEVLQAAREIAAARNVTSAFWSRSFCGQRLLGRPMQNALFTATDFRKLKQAGQLSPLK